MPHAGAWITAAFYWLAAYSCRLAATHSNAQPREAFLWSSIAVLLVVLGFAELLSLESVLTSLGRATAMKEGWYGQRQRSQIAFIQISLALTLVLIYGLLLSARNTSLQCKVALTFASLIVGYALVRASSLHYVDAILLRTVFGLHFNHIPEFVAIGIVLLASRGYKPPESDHLNRAPVRVTIEISDLRDQPFAQDDRRFGWKNRPRRPS
jgi:hypothetical protein